MNFHVQAMCSRKATIWVLYVASLVCIQPSSVPRVSNLHLGPNAMIARFRLWKVIDIVVEHHNRIGMLIGVSSILRCSLADTYGDSKR